MRIFFDTEFLEDGKTIDLISIGMVREDGEELYLVNRDADWRRIYADPWLTENVVPHLPEPRKWRDRHIIRELVLEFAGAPWKQLAGVVPSMRVPSVRPEFWAYYADYDWVVLCQLFGRMIDLPKGWPMYCRDFKQVVDERGLELRKQTDGEHDALCDARWLRDEYDRLMGDPAP